MAEANGVFGIYINTSTSLSQNLPSGQQGGAPHGHSIMGPSGAAKESGKRVFIGVQPMKQLGTI